MIIIPSMRDTGSVPICPSSNSKPPPTRFPLRKQSLKQTKTVLKHACRHTSVTAQAKSKRAKLCPLRLPPVKTMTTRYQFAANKHLRTILLHRSYRDDMAETNGCVLFYAPSAPLILITKVKVSFFLLAHILFC